MSLTDYIINDIELLSGKTSIKDVKALFSQFTYSHLPVEKDGIYYGCLSETDVHCYDSYKNVEDYLYSLEGFYVRNDVLWLDVLEVFAQNETNILPVLDKNNVYLGYYELNDIITLFNATPFFSENGNLLVVEKGYNDYSFSEVSQIVESDNAKLLGVFVSKLKNDVVQLTLKINNSDLNAIIQSFRRYGYNVVSQHKDDAFVQNLKERSEYLNKYLNI